jgi:hypothetical protein
MDSMQWFVGGFSKSRWEVLLTETVGDRGVADCIGAEHSNKFLVDGGEPRVASSRETSRLIADPLNCMLRLNIILHFFLTNLDFSLYTHKLKENFSVMIIGNVFSMGCNVHPRARPLMLDLSGPPYRSCL